MGGWWWLGGGGGFGGGGEGGGFVRPPTPSHVLVPNRKTLLGMYLTIPMTSATSDHTMPVNNSC